MCRIVVVVCSWKCDRKCEGCHRVSGRKTLNSFHMTNNIRLRITVFYTLKIGFKLLDNVKTKGRFTFKPT